MNSWHSYPSIFALGHRAIRDLLTVPVNVEEKIDGSQFSFGYSENGDLLVRSKGAKMHPDAPERMFTKAVETAKSLNGIARQGWTYRCEFLAKPKHNTLAYERTPKHYLILFDVNTEHEEYLAYEQKKSEAQRIGLECVPLLFSGSLSTVEEFSDFLATDSVLGGQKIEGVVVKPSAYNLFGEDKKCLMGKFVSEFFKEVHSREWKSSNPSQNDILNQLAVDYRTPARWQKAIQHLSESGQLDGSLRDIGKLMKEIPADIEKECAEEIKERLYRWAWPHIRRMVTAGMPEWYKEELLKKQFEQQSAEV